MELIGLIGSRIDGYRPVFTREGELDSGEATLEPKAAPTL